LVIFINLSVFSQEDAWVYFNAKPNAQAYYNAPLTMLTQRSLDRRILQNIPLDFKDIPIHQLYIDQVEAATGITVKAKSKWFNAVHVQGSQIDIQALSALTFVDHLDFANSSLNSGGKIASVKTKDKINKTYDSQVLFNYGNSANQIQMLNGHLLHQQNYTGTGKIIAVMDGGFPGVNTIAPFSRLRDNNLILGGYDFVNRNANFYTGITHGTLVLSTMGGYVANQLVGTAPDASYYLFITEDGANESPLELSLWVEAAEEADRLGVDIINTSLGYTVFDNPNYNFTYSDMDGTTAFISKGVDIAFSRGMICVVSAGNSGSSTWQYISAPADAVHALAVGAVNAAGSYATFSSQGPSFDQRVKPDVVAQGQLAVVSNATGSVTTASGTSFSGPIIAGMVAGFWQALPNKTNSHIVQLIKQSASIYSTPNSFLGYGIPNFNLALTSGLEVVGITPDVFELYPNPVQNNISIVFPNEFKNANVVFYNTLGQIVLDQNVSNDKALIQLNFLKTGVYIYRIQSNNYSQTGKILKQ
jgi:hypothetical protein